MSEQLIYHNIIFGSECLERVEKIVHQKVTHYKIDIRDKEALNKVFTMVSCRGCIAFLVYIFLVSWVPYTYDR